MKYLKTTLASLLLIASLFLSGCGGNNSDTPPSSSDTAIVDGNDTSPDINITVPVVENNVTKLTLVMPVSATVLTTNSQVVNIEVRMFDSSNNPYSVGTITKTNPNDVLTGRDIGTFDKITSTLTNGVARFVYTAPDQLDANTSNLNFSFYHDSNTSDARIYTMSIVPEANQTVFTSYDLKASNDADKTIGLESTKNISYSVVDSSNKPLENSDITLLRVTLLNPSLAMLRDSSGNSGDTLSFVDNAYSVNVVTNTRSGLVPIKVDATFIDSNGVEQNLTKVFDLVVHSGPPTAMSLSYAGTGQNAGNAKFIENWVLTATDKYNNLINTTPSVSMGAIIGYAQSSGVTANPEGYLYYPANSLLSGTLSDVNPDTTFEAGNVFNHVDVVNDTLVLFGTGYKFNAFGKWDIGTISASNLLTLVDKYDGNITDDLGFAVGHNFRNEVCGNQNSVVANVYAQNGENTLPSSGSMIIQVEYDYYLVGKDVMLWTNLVGSSNNEIVRVGLGRKTTLVGQGIEAESFTFTDAFTGPIKIHLKISNTERNYENARFWYTIKATGNGVSYSELGNSMSNIYSCDDGGRAYVDVNITSGGDEGGTISLEGISFGNEF